jgi:hypothetical protein
MADFPINEYLQAFQTKYANEQAAKPDIGQILATSIQNGTTAAVNQFAKEQELQKQRAWEGYLQYTKDKKLVSVSNANEEAPMDAVMQVNNMVARGKYKMKGDKDGSLILADANGTPLYKWVTKEEYNIMPTTVPEGMEVVGYDSKGRPQLRKVKEEVNIVQKTLDATEAREEGKEKVKAKKEYIAAQTLSEQAVPKLDVLIEKNKVSVNGKLEGLAYKGSQLTGLGTDSDKFQNTAFVVQQLREMVARVLKAQFGGQLSEGEREYLNSVYGAAPDYTRKERDIAIRNVRQMLIDKTTEKRTAFEMWEKPSTTSTANVEIGMGGQGGAGGMITIQASDGTRHQIPSKNLEAAKKIDPTLKVINNGL